MKFTFIGDGDNDPQAITAFGYAFELGGPAVEVEDAHAIRKLSGNANFAQGEAVAAAPVKRKYVRKAVPSLPPVIQQVEVSDDD